MNEIVEVITNSDGLSATSVIGSKKYKIESVMLGVGNKRRPVSHTKNFLSPGHKFSAEVLPNGKLNIL